MLGYNYSLLDSIGRAHPNHAQSKLNYFLNNYRKRRFFKRMKKGGN